MRNLLNIDQVYYFDNKMVKIIKQFPTHNLAIVQDINSLMEYKINIRFLTTEFVKEYYITYKI